MKQKDLLFILISSTLLAIVWIIFTILHNSLSSTITQSVSQQIVPIEGRFDAKTLQAIQKRTPITPVSSIQGTDNITLTPTPTLPPVAAISPLSSSSAQISTQSGGKQ